MRLPEINSTGSKQGVTNHDHNPSSPDKSDRQILQTVLPSISGLDQLVPDKRTIGTEKWPGNEFVVNYGNGACSRIAYYRHKQHFYLLVAMCADSQPGLPPDPFASDFALSPNVDYFFNSLKLKPQ